jgi:glycosyltransferase involved in cell wall biosynthesis
VDRYFCISRGVRDVLLRGGVPESRLALVPSGVPLPDPAAIAGRARQRPALRLELGLPSECRVIGTVAALAPHKNHADLLEAAARVVRVRPEVHFVWVGEGECRAALERRRRELALERHVHLLGFRDDVLELLQQFTLFALSSYLEGLCTSLLDAQALGIPIVATAVGGIPDVVENGVTGRLVPGRDPEAFANALLEALDHPEQAAERAERARETVRAFRVEALAERSVQEYHAVLRDRAARAGAR